jgi:hypothetical protein
MGADWNSLFAAIYDKPESWRYRLHVNRLSGSWAETEIEFTVAKGVCKILCEVKGPADFVVAALTAAVEKFESPGPYKP